MIAAVTPARGISKLAAMSILLAVLALASIACGGDESDTTSARTGDTALVTIDNFMFTPDNLAVKVGATVTWRNVQGTPHTVTGDSDEFDSAELPQDAEFSQTFATTGTFRYHCSIHPTMAGSVTVTE